MPTLDDPSLDLILAPGNRAKSMAAPVLAILGYDLDFPETLPRTFHNPDARGWFDKPSHRESTAFRNGTLQGAYLIIAARALGFDCGPMSGFDHHGVDRDFFAGTNIKSNFVMALGRGTDENLYPRNPRLPFEETNTIV